jgi:NADP-dependent 3-hydroxy acid dehydrogenase YdfG
MEKINVFFNNAGIERVVKPIIDYPEEIFDQVISVNIKGLSVAALASLLKISARCA